MSDRVKVMSLVSVRRPMPSFSCRRPYKLPISRKPCPAPAASSSPPRPSFRSWPGGCKRRGLHSSLDLAFRFTSLWIYKLKTYIYFHYFSHSAIYFDDTIRAYLYLFAGGAV